jgi:hypothetical protein
MLAVELDPWDRDERGDGGSRFPMREDLATTVTCKNRWTPEQKDVLDRVHARARLVIDPFSVAGWIHPVAAQRRDGDPPRREVWIRIGLDPRRV